MSYPSTEKMKEELKKYFGWDDEMIVWLQYHKGGVNLLYQIMLKEVRKQ